MDKLMIIGGSGLLGGHLARFAQEEYEVVATYMGHPIEIPGCRTTSMDIRDFYKTENKISKEKPDLIILSAAQRNVDYCEKKPEEVWKINVQGAKNVAIASKKVQAKLIYLSTDLVFDGEKEGYQEEEDPNPINYYGKTKLEGEKEVAKACEDYAIARVSVLYDWNPFEHTFNFVSWVYNSLKEKKEISLFTDQFRNATYIKNACDALLGIHKKGEQGIFHVAGKNCVNRHEIGEKVAEIFGFDEKLITTCTSEDSNWVAKRPKRCCLNSEKMNDRLGIKSMSIEEGLDAMKREIQ
ncbi:MAG: SDR family oxidoreductase [Thermoplasmata archaeon]|nr:MAG: SDR family oxidoreductase [Thermoplasmata archaeon]